MPKCVFVSKQTGINVMCILNKSNIKHFIMITFYNFWFFFLLRINKQVQQQQTPPAKRVPEEIDSNCHRNVSAVESTLETNVFKRTSQQAQAAANQPIHNRQRSYDVVSSIQLREELGDLPQGWEQTRTPEGQIYFLEWVLKCFKFFFLLLRSKKFWKQIVIISQDVRSIN